MESRPPSLTLLTVLTAIVIASALGSVQAPAQTIITEIIDSTGDGAGNALDGASGIAVDAANNVYVTGGGSDNAFRITPAGVVTQIIDATGDGAGNFLDGPSAIAVDAEGNVYVTGQRSDNAFKITPDGIITQIIDSTGDGAGNTLDGPFEITVDAAGNVYLTGFISDNAFKITPAGVIFEIIDATGDGAGNGLDSPRDIAVDAAGNTYVTGAASDNAFKITPDGVITQIIDATGDGAGNILDLPSGIALDAAGNAYVVGTFSRNAFRITPDGIITQIIDATADGVGSILDDPFGIAVDSVGNAYVTGAFSNNAFRITPHGIITQIIDSTGDGAGNGLHTPRPIAVDFAGNAFVTGQFSNNAFRISPDCNNNGIPDEVDIANCGLGNTACADCNANNIPDDCDTRVQFTAFTISTAANGANSVFATDLDGDNDFDVLSASIVDHKIAWYEQIDAAGSFGPQQVIFIEDDVARSVFAVDLDGDEDIDVLSASGTLGSSSGTYGKVAWYENVDGAGSFGAQNVISTDLWSPKSVFAADLDGDEHPDVLSASRDDDKIAWYENVDGAGSFGPQQVITTEAASPYSVFAADIDGDGDYDVLSGSDQDRKIAWYENTNGLGSFGPQQIISTDADGARSVVAADLDGDGDLDALSASWRDDKIAWYENTDGAGTFGPQQVISVLAYRANAVFAADLDGDGDNDVLSASRADNKIAWYENLDGAGTFGPQRVITITALNANSVFAADLDADGDTDVLSASGVDDKIAWYKNTSNDCNGNGVPDECEVDTDGDATIDHCDNCPNEPALTDPDEPGTELTCNDVIDNDCDGLTDGADPNCACRCADLTENGFTDLDDFATFAGCFNKPASASGCLCSDLTANGFIDLEDFATFAGLFNQAWNGQAPPNCS